MEDDCSQVSFTGTRSGKGIPARESGYGASQRQATNVYFSAVIRDSEQTDHIYDLAFALPAITAPLKQSAPKQYPSLYLYPNLRDVPASGSYRHFYPASFVSDVVSFDQSHTMFPTGESPVFSFRINASTQTELAKVSQKSALLTDRAKHSRAGN